MKYLIRDLPSYVVKNKKGTKWYLNLNNYRNSHYRVCANVKNKYKLTIVNTYELTPVPFDPPYTLTYTLYFENKRVIDIMNFGSILDKFVVDALVELDVIGGDDRSYIKCIRFIDGGIKKNNRCADLLITPYKD